MTPIVTRNTSRTMFIERTWRSAWRTGAPTRSNLIRGAHAPMNIWVAVITAALVIAWFSESHTRERVLIREQALANQQVIGLLPLPVRAGAPPLPTPLAGRRTNSASSSSPQYRSPYAPRRSNSTRSTARFRYIPQGAAIAHRIRSGADEPGRRLPVLPAKRPVRVPLL